MVVVAVEIEREKKEARPRVLGTERERKCIAIVVDLCVINPEGNWEIRGLGFLSGDFIAME